MKTGDIVFCRQKTLISYLVQFLDKGHFSHVGIFIAPNKILEVNWNTYVDVNDFTYTDYEVVDLNLTETQRKNIVFYGEQLKGDYYDFRKLIWLFFYRVFGVNIPWIDNKHAFICSELVETLLAMVGAIPSSEVGKHSPSSLYEYLIKIK